MATPSGKPAHLIYCDLVGSGPGLTDRLTHHTGDFADYWVRDKVKNLDWGLPEHSFVYRGQPVDDLTLNFLLANRAWRKAAARALYLTKLPFDERACILVFALRLPTRTKAAAEEAARTRSEMVQKP